MVVALGWIVVGCKPASPSAGEGKVAQLPVGARTFYVKGVVREVREAGNTVRIQHEEIPDYMAAMTMPFSVKDTRELAGLAPGQTVLFRLVVTDDDSWIDEVTSLPEIATEPAPPETTRQVRWVEPLEEGQMLPPYPLTNQLGQPFGLTDFKGEVLAFTFIYTRCPLPNFCPRMTSHFLEAQRLLRTDPSAPKRWRLFDDLVRSGTRHARRAEGLRRPAGERPRTMAVRDRRPRGTRCVDRAVWPELWPPRRHL